MAAGQVSFSWEPCRTLFAEPNIRDLLTEHWEELGVTKADCPLDPDFARFVQLNEAGLFRVWAARDGKLLMGYIAFFVQPHLHHRTTLHAVEDLYMLSAPYRHGLTGYRMFTSAIDALRELGVKRLITHEKTHFEAERGGLGKFFLRLGFVHTDNIWIKIL